MRPNPPLCELIGTLPKPPDTACQAQAEIWVAALQSIREGSAQVVHFGRQSLRVGSTGILGELWLDLFRDVAEVAGVTFGDLTCFFGKVELFGGELSNHFEHRESSFSDLDGTTQEAPGEEPFDTIEGVGFGESTDQRCGVESESSHEHAKSAKQCLILGVQQFVAPGDGVAHGAMPVGGVGRSCGEKGEPLLEAAEKFVRCQQLDSGRSQLDCEGQPVEPGGDLRHGSSVCDVEFEVGSGCSGTSQEEGHRVVRGQTLQVGEWIEGRHV